MSAFQWNRRLPLDPQKESVETWSFQNGKTSQDFPVRTEYGKKLNPFNLKEKVIQDFQKTVASLRQKNEAIFASSDLEKLEACPVCAASAGSSVPEVKIYGGTYCRCKSCGHCFVKERPTLAALQKFYTEDSTYQATYADPDLLRVRMETVAMPKMAWIIAQYEKQFGRKPKSILDVGAGSGHMVKAAIDSGVASDGVELSKSGIGFAKLNFKIDLKQLDFIREADKLAQYDIITFWGVIEHMSDPLAALKTAVKKLTPQGMLFAEVPRWHSISTAVQKIFPERIVRHLEPSTHIHIFSDASLATLFLKSGFAPAAAWYFGLDTYEAMIQFAAESKASVSAQPLMVESLQQTLDSNHLSDFLLLAGIPSSLNLSGNL